jgi:hypothetical protein
MTISKAAEMAPQWWTDRLQQGDKSTFKATLENLIQIELDSDGRCFTNVDYDPSGPVLEAVRAAGVECQGFMFSAKGILPMKTSLWVYPDKLSPREGYGNWTDEIKVPQ